MGSLFFRVHVDSPLHSADTGIFLMGKPAKRKSKAPSTEDAPHTPPVFKGSFKHKHLRKHASLLRGGNCEGFLISASSYGTETRAFAQCLAFVNAYLPILYPASKLPEPNTEDDIDEDGDDDEKNEMDGKEGKKSGRGFQFVDAGCLGVFFMRIVNGINPVEFLMKFYDHVDAITDPREKLKVASNLSYTSRFIPIETCCVPNMIDLRQHAESFLSGKWEKFGLDKGGSEKTLAVVCEARNNEELKRDEIIKMVAGLIPSHLKVKLTDPDFVIMVQVFKSVVGLSFVPRQGYHSKLKRFNLAAYMNKK
ncbi:hypothetical protein BJ742DRAFT_881581 [Cladochytrium replicatum]|nr:hypothetical protein BJ742DRAFT_881581 [Cladochytrium replicatum]